MGCYFFSGRWVSLSRAVSVIEEIKEVRQLKAEAHTSVSMIHLFLMYLLHLTIWRGTEVGSFFFQEESF